VTKRILSKQGKTTVEKEVVSRDRLTKAHPWDLTKLPAPLAWPIAKRFKVTQAWQPVIQAKSDAVRADDWTFPSQVIIKEIKQVPVTESGVQTHDDQQQDTPSPNEQAIESNRSERSNVGEEPSEEDEMSIHVGDDWTEEEDSQSETSQPVPDEEMHERGLKRLRHSSTPSTTASQSHTPMEKRGRLRELTPEANELPVDTASQSRQLRL
jgi:hypothetical protein